MRSSPKAVRERARAIAALHPRQPSPVIEPLIVAPEHRDAECPVLSDDHLMRGELDRPEDC